MHLRRNTLYWVLCIIVKIVFSACWITHVLRNLIASLTLSLTNPVNFCAENCPHLPRPDPHTQTHACKQNMFPSCNNSTFTTVHFDIHSFTCYREEEGKENVLRISSFALCWSSLNGGTIGEAVKGLKQKLLKCTGFRGIRIYGIPAVWRHSNYTFYCSGNDVIKAFEANAVISWSWHDQGKTGGM